MAVKKPKKERPKLPALPLEPAFREKVDAAKMNYAGKSIAELGREGEECERRRKVLLEELKLIGIELAAIGQLALDALQAEGMLNYKLDDGVLVHQRSHVTVRIEDAAAFRAYAEANKMMDLYQPNTKTLAAMVRARYENGEGDLPGVAVYLSMSIGYKGIQTQTGGENEDEPINEDRPGNA